MAVGMTANLANKVLDHLRGGTAWSQPAGLYIKLHTAEPGASGTANAAGNTTRTLSTFGSAASGGAMSNTVQVQWTAVSTSETYSHVSLWDAGTGGSCLWTGSLGAPVAVTSGGTFTIAVGEVDITFSIAS
jgi:hypothetical protein